MREFSNAVKVEGSSGQLAPVKSGCQGPEAARGIKAPAWIDHQPPSIIFSVLPTTHPRPKKIYLKQHDRIRAKENPK